MKTYTGRGRRSDAARVSLLEAARRVAAREGAARVRLSIVADEADVARTTAYGYFRSRDELLQSVIADDLTLLARIMRDASGLPPPPEAPPTPTHIVRFELRPPAQSTAEDQKVVDQAVGNDTGICTTPNARTDEHESVDHALPHSERLDETHSASPGDIGTQGECTEYATELSSDASSKTQLSDPIVSLPEGATGTTGEYDSSDSPTSNETPQSEVQEIVAPVDASVEDHAEDNCSDRPIPNNTRQYESGETFASSAASVENCPEDDSLERLIAGARHCEGEGIIAPLAATAEEHPAAPDEVTAKSAASQTEESVGLADGTKNVVAEQPPAAPAHRLAARLPDRDERIRIVGKRVLATAELREKVKRLAPVYSPENEGLAEKVSRLEQSIAALDPSFHEKLERRLSNLERNVSALEEGAANVSEGHEAALGALRETVLTLDARSAAANKVQQDTMLKMMTELRGAMCRLDQLGSQEQVGTALPQQQNPAPDDFVFGEEVENVQAEGQSISEPERVSSAPERSDYLASARRAAMSAIATQVEEATKRRAERKRRQLRRNLAVLAIAVLATGAIAVAVRDFAVPLANTQRSALAAHPLHKVAKPADRTRRQHARAMTPLDRLSESARAGSPVAELAIGLKYLSGDGIAKNETEAARWISKAAQGGNPAAESWLGSLYQHGRGVAADPAQALSWFKRSAQDGNPRGMHALAIAYAQGSGVPVNFFEAARWFSRAADLGYVDSAFNLAVLYERGDGVPQSLLDAYKWYAVAAATGDDEARNRMTAIGAELSADDLSAAQKAAASFRASPVPAPDSLAAQLPASR